MHMALVSEWGLQSSEPHSQETQCAMGPAIVSLKMRILTSWTQTAEGFEYYAFCNIALY